MNKQLNPGRFPSLLARVAMLGALTASTALAQNFDTTLLNDGPLAFWPLTETTASPAPPTITNSTGAVDGYVIGGVVLGQAGAGPYGNPCPFFNNGNTGATVGNSTEKIDVPYRAAINPNPPYTIEFWAKPSLPVSTDSTGISPLSEMNPYFFPVNRSGMIFYLGSGGWQVKIGGVGGYAAQAGPTHGGVTEGNWELIAGVYDGATNYLYINGNLAAASAAAPGVFITNGWVPLRIGSTMFEGGSSRDGEPGAGNRGWDGWVSEVSVYPSALSAAREAAHFAAGSLAGYHAAVLADNPVGFWPLEDATYNLPATNSYPVSAAQGALGASADGTNELGALAAQPGPGFQGFNAADHAVFYDGETGYTATDITTNLAGEQVTYLAWIKPQSTTGWRNIIEQGFDPSTGAENYFRISDTVDWEGAGNTYTEYYEVGEYPPDGAAYASATYPVPAGDIGNWVFLAGTWDGANWNLYRDGALVAQTSDPSGPTAVPNNPPWTIGALSDPNQSEGWFFDGDIADPAIFNKALSAAQILALYNASKAPAVITTPLAAPTSPVYLGSSYTFSVGADGVQPLSYQWISNGVTLANQSGTSLTLTDVGPGANGTYSVIVTNLYGAATSSVVFAVTPSLPPVSVAPDTETRWTGFPFQFYPEGVGSAVVNYSWNHNGSSAGVTTSNIIGNATSATAGSYTVTLSNPYGNITSSNAGVLTVLPIPTASAYVGTVLADHPVAYYRLDETSGSVAHDYAGGHDGAYYDAILDQPGFVPSQIDPDPAAGFSGATGSYVGNIAADNSVSFAGTTNFTIEAWTKGVANQINGAAIVAKGAGDVGNVYPQEQFALRVNVADYSFLVRSPAQSTANGYEAVGTTGPDGSWHHLVGVWDGSAVNLYVDGALQTTVGGPSTVRASTVPISIGAERSGNAPSYDLAYNGDIDEVAIYNYALTANQVQAHYAAAYGSSLAPQIALEPVSYTNYQGMAVTFQTSAFGSVPLSYQWNKAGSGAVSGATSASLTFDPLALSDAGTYTCIISNNIGTTSTVPVVLTVLPPPSSPPALADLVVHLTFDNTLVDATGRGNNGTNMASGAYTPQNSYAPGKIGVSALTYETDTNSAETNVSAHYVTLGVRPDLQFSNNVDFTVAFWIQEPQGYAGNDLPFFTDVVGSTFGDPGYVFAPTYGQNGGNWPGGWAYSLFDSGGNGIGVYGDTYRIDDGGWHHLAFVFDRKHGETTYCDGVSILEDPNDFFALPYTQAGTTAAAAGDIDSTQPATIGQDPTGQYEQSGGPFLIDDFLVFRRAITPLEVGAIYAAGSETPALSVTNATVVTGTFTYSIGPNNSLILNWSGGTLQSSTNVTGPYTDTTAVSPFTVPTTNTASFFRVKF